MTAGSFDSLAKLGRGRTRAVVNRDVAPTAAFTLDGDMAFDRAALFDAIRGAAGHNLTELVDATRTATALLGDAIATNMFMVGYAAQRGLLPVSIAALERAIELNGVAVEANKEALGWGRVQAARPDEVRAVLDRAGAAPEPEPVAETFEEIVEDRDGAAHRLAGRPLTPSATAPSSRGRRRRTGRSAIPRSTSPARSRAMRRS